MVEKECLRLPSKFCNESFNLNALFGFTVSCSLRTGGSKWACKYNEMSWQLCYILAKKWRPTCELKLINVNLLTLLDKTFNPTQGLVQVSTFRHRNITTVEKCSEPISITWVGKMTKGKCTVTALSLAEVSFVKHDNTGCSFVFVSLPLSCPAQKPFCLAFHGGYVLWATFSDVTTLSVEKIKRVHANTLVPSWICHVVATLHLVFSRII